ncbi:hypothetical protein EMPG_17019 [Blastomyces silverae]|uniref:Uncharacterized protein n=1 Tax=Blastomyces silverae TaxID=2060906 RepID=A0A0H1B8T7_9EURO|nr:hypothetical protein EMPG_17019 [Blastomyces silverae]
MHAQFPSITPHSKRGPGRRCAFSALTVEPQVLYQINKAGIYYSVHPGMKTQHLSTTTEDATKG